MIISEIRKNKSNIALKTQIIKVICGRCKKNYSIAYHYYERGRNKYNKDLCRGCKTSLRCKGRSIEELYGKENAKLYREKMSKIFKKNYKGAKGYKWTEEQKRNLKKVRPNTGTYEERYGKEKADSLKRNLSKLSSGKRNRMYGKSTPIGSGNGWSGWYKNWYFRSILELSYMINIIEKNSHIWESAEKSKYTIPYFTANKNRTYRADFIIDNKYMIEVKPRRLLNSEFVKIKKLFAEEWCKKRGFIYRIVSEREFNRVSYEEIRLLYLEKKIVFLEKYDIKFNRHIYKIMI